MSTHSSAQRIAANQANAQHSTGPKTDAGKATSSRNAVTTALTGRTVLLPGDDLHLYNNHLASYRDEFRPATERETVLVQAIADTDWRLSRIPHLIMALEAKGLDEVIQESQGKDDGYLSLNGFLRYEKQIRNLYLQESRLHRRRDKDLEALRLMQQARQADRNRQLYAASQLYVAAQEQSAPFHPADHGFEFSNADIEDYLFKIRNTRSGRTLFGEGQTTHARSLAS